MVYRKNTPEPTRWTRRDLMFAAAGAASVALLPRESQAAKKTPAPIDPNAKKILILGDSMIAGAVGLFLENGLRKEHGYSVRRKGKS